MQKSLLIKFNIQFIIEVLESIGILGTYINIIEAIFRLCMHRQYHPKWSSKVILTYHRINICVQLLGSKKTDKDTQITICFLTGLLYCPGTREMEPMFFSPFPAPLREVAPQKAVWITKPPSSQGSCQSVNGQLIIVLYLGSDDSKCGIQIPPLSSLLLHS